MGKHAAEGTCDSMSLCQWGPREPGLLTGVLGPILEAVWSVLPTSGLGPGGLSPVALLFTHGQALGGQEIGGLGHLQHRARCSTECDGEGWEEVRWGLAPIAVTEMVAA